MNTRIPIRLPTLRDYSHDARQIIIVSGLIAISYFGVFALLRGLYLLRLGYDTSFLGTYYATGALTFMSMGVPSGALGQRLGTRRVMLVGGWVVAGGMFLLPLAAGAPVALARLLPLASQVVTTIGWSMFSVNSVPALMLVTSDANRASAYALTSVLRGIGTFLGTLLGGVLPAIVVRLIATRVPVSIALETAAPYAWALFVGAILGLSAILPLSRIRGGLRPTATETKSVAKGAFPFSLVVGLIAYVFARHMGWTTCQAYCSPYMDTDLALSTSSIGALTSIGQIAAIIATLLLPRMLRRWSHGSILAITTGVQIGSLALLAFVPHWSAAALGLLGVQVSAAVWIPELQIYQMELVSEGWRGLAYGAVTMAMGLGFGSMSYFGGRLITAKGYARLFTIGAALSAVATVLMVGISRWARAGADATRVRPAGTEGVVAD
ncbi:MAG: MFS transporter [Anaerolineae bacterium]|nr:MFS transporter [Anaerolineae bacterium]